MVMACVDPRLGGRSGNVWDKCAPVIEERRPQHADCHHHRPEIRRPQIRALHHRYSRSGTYSLLALFRNTISALGSESIAISGSVHTSQQRSCFVDRMSCDFLAFSNLSLSLGFESETNPDLFHPVSAYFQFHVFGM